jgi:hypothetical protein
VSTRHIGSECDSGSRRIQNAHTEYQSKRGDSPRRMTGLGAHQHGSNGQRARGVELERVGIGDRG